MRNPNPRKMLTLAGVSLALLAAPVLHQTIAARTLAASEAQAAQAKPAEAPITTTLNDQTDIALTVYNSQLALVRDTRQLNLPTGESQLRFMDIAASVNPATVYFRS